MLVEALRVIFSTLVVATAAFGIGSLIWHRLPSSFSRFDRLACAWLGGLGLLGTLLFLIGQFAFTRTTIFLTLGAGAVAGIAHLAREGKATFALPIREMKVPALPAIVIAAVLIVTALGGLSEAVGDWGNDAVVYHLVGPKVWLRDGIVRPLADNSHTAFPATAEILYGSLMALGGERAPGFLAFLTLTMFLLAVASLAARLGLDSRGAWWAAALVAVMPAVYAGAHSGFVDVLYASLVLAAARVGFDAQSTREWVAFGVFCGLAIGTKYTGLLALLPLVLCSSIQFVTSRKGSVGSVTKQIGMAFAVAFAVSGPFYLRNWIVLGCPIYPPPPILSHWFHVRYLSPAAVAGYHSYILKRGAGLGRGLGAYLLLPFNLTYHTANFHGAGGIGLAPLALGPLGMVAPRRDAFARTLALLGLLLTTLWFVTDQESRFLIHAYVIAAILAVIGWRYAACAAPRLSSLLASAVIACSLLYGLFMIGSSRLDDIHAVFSKSFAQQRRETRIPFFESFQRLNSDASVREVLILDPSVPPYYSAKSYLKPIGQWGEQTLPDARDLDHLLARLPELGVSHVLDVNSAYYPFRVAARTPGLTLVFERPNQRIYRVE